MQHDMAMGLGQILMVLVWIVVVLVPFWKITQRAGYPGWLALLMIVPLVNLGFLYFLAFARWPSLEGRGD